ncbi:MAG: SPOR domain-containing protein [Pseudomonadota bacterium]
MVAIRWVVACLAGWLVISAANADVFLRGRTAYLERNYEQAFLIWSQAATAGDARAQFGLGTLYHEGSGVPQDLSKATGWFRAAANQGYAPAQFNLGNAYRRGDGVNRDEDLATTWWRKAAEQDFAPAQYNLATQYYFGRGVPEDHTIAMIYYQRAANQGHPDAIAVIRTLEAGGVPQLVDEKGVALAAKRSPGATATAATAATATGPTKAKQKASVKKPLVDLADDRAWLASAHPDYFTAQLITVSSREAAKRFIASRQWPYPVASFDFERSGKRLFAVVLGAFPSREAAQSAARETGSDDAWIRPVSSLNGG